MVRVPRRPKDPPPKLAANQRNWTDRWKEIHLSKSKSDWATPAAKKILKEAMEKMAHGKCVFCEGILNAQAYLEVEHYVAKTVEHALAFEWTNLFPACAICNGSKSDEDHKGALLKPDEDDPEDYFLVHPEGWLEPRPDLTPEQKSRAKETIRICDLQRAQLRTLRRQTLVRCGEWILNGGYKRRKDDLLEPHREYKLAIRHQLRTFGHPDPADEGKRCFEA